MIGLLGVLVLLFIGIAYLGFLVIRDFVTSPYDWGWGIALFVIFAMVETYFGFAIYGVWSQIT